MPTVFWKQPTVFNLSHEEKIILRYLAEVPTNISRLSKRTELHTDSRLGRWAVRNKIEKTKNKLGLVRLGYVIIKNDKKRHGNKQEKIIHLTLKGLLAVIEAGMKLEDTYVFKTYFEFISKKIQDKNILLIVENYIKNQISFFLLFHKLIGQQLIIVPYIVINYREFCEKSWDHQISDIPLNHLDEKSQSLLETTLARYLKSSRNLIKVEKSINVPIKMRLYDRFDLTRVVQEKNQTESIKPFSTTQISLKKVLHEWYVFIIEIALGYEPNADFLTSYPIEPASEEDIVMLN